MHEDSSHPDAQLSYRALHHWRNTDISGHVRWGLDASLLQTPKCRNILRESIYRHKRESESYLLKAAGYWEKKYKKVIFSLSVKEIFTGLFREIIITEWVSHFFFHCKRLWILMLFYWFQHKKTLENMASEPPAEVNIPPFLWSKRFPCPKLLFKWCWGRDVSVCRGRRAVRSRFIEFDLTAAYTVTSPLCCLFLQVNLTFLWFFSFPAHFSA